MAKNVPFSYSNFDGGIADFPRDHKIPNSFAFSRSADTRTDPQNVSILPKTIKESGSTVTDLVKWADTIPTTLNTYLYGNTGNFYKRTSAGSYSLLRSVANSHGNGLSYFAEDDFVYYTSDKVIGRYGPISATTPQFTDDYFGSQGGVPLNTNSLSLTAASSQYADRADTASLSIIGNLAISTQIKPTSLPTTGNNMALVAKWTENGNARSYKLDLATVAGYFGDGSNGSYTVSVDTTDAPIDSACTGTVSTTTLTATNTSFATGQVIFIHQTQGTGAGTWQKNAISSYTAGTITLQSALNATYTTGAQVLVLKQYTNVTINSGITLTVKAWNGTVGGILSFVANGTITVSGNIVANGGNGISDSSNNNAGTGGGFRGGIGYNQAVPCTGGTGEGTTGVSTQSIVVNGNGAGAGKVLSAPGAAPGGGGGHSAAGGNGAAAQNGISGVGGGVAGSADLTTMVFGGGGAGGSGNAVGSRGGGGSGGGIIFLVGVTITVTGAITSNGGAGGSVGGAIPGDGGGGAGGSVLLKAQTATLGTSLITASGGSGNTYGGDGSAGRVHLDYYTSYTGTTTPTLDFVQDNTLVTNTTQQIRLSLSSNGTNVETLNQIINVQTGIWQQVGVSWTASTSTAIFYLNAVVIGTRVGTFTSISDNTSKFGISRYLDGTSTAVSFYDGLMDEVQIFNVTRSASDFFNSLASQILSTTSGLVAYYKLNGDYADATANTNTLTATNTPVFVSDVPFPSPTTRLDIDQSTTTAGNDYDVPTAISEGTTERKTFTPAKDPQKSVAFLILATGTGNWTITVHDSLNNIIATSTVTNANLNTGYYEFTYASVWRPLTNFTSQYHFHITSTVNDGTVTSGTDDDLETVSFRTYYQFLVNDSDYHPVAKMLEFLVIGNERYVATYSATLYDPNALVLPAGYRVRCFGYFLEYLVIGTWKGTTITDFDSGRIYFWDGIAPTYNFYIDVPEGGINALLGTPNKLYLWAGYKGDLLAYQGGISAQKIKRVPLVGTGTVEIYPGAVTMWSALLRFGVGSSTSTNIQKGGYTYGSVNSRYPDSLTFDYPISTGNYLDTVKIGLLATVGNKLLIGWQDNIGYGIDYVSTSNAPYSSATVEFLIEDNDLIWKEKQVVLPVANFVALTSGQSISLKLKLDDDTDWTLNQDATTTGDTVSRMVVPNGRYHQTQVAVDLFTSSSTAPIINGISIETEGHETSGRVG